MSQQSVEASEDDDLVARLRRHARSRLPSEAAPEQIVVVSELPTLPNGKVDRNVLARLAAGAGGEAVPDPPRDGADSGAALLTQMFASALSRPRLGVDDDLTMAGAGSLQLVQVCAAWAALTGRHVDGALLAGNPTVRTITTHAALPAGMSGKLEVRDHRFLVPLDHDRPAGPAISVFARTVRRGEQDLPYLLFLQGGPGGQCPDPREKLSAWLDVALDHFQVVLLDQRGGGRSSPEAVEAAADLPPAAAAERLRCFRADAVVRDAEILRERVLGTPAWTILAESYGGAIALSYVSFFPGSVDRVLISSGLVGPVGDIDEILAETLAVSRAKNAEYYERYPGDVEAVDRIVRHLARADVVLPDGDRLSPGRFAMLGVTFGFAGGMAAVHELVGAAWDGDELTDAFLRSVAARTMFTRSPMFYLQEFTYGRPGRATGWSAHRLSRADPAFDPDARPFPFTAEVFFPWIFQEIGLLKPYAAVAGELAAYSGWNDLYDADRLRDNTVPIYAVAVPDDLYVPFHQQVRTARAIGCCWLMVSPARDHTALMNDRVAFARFLAFAAEPERS